MLILLFLQLSFAQKMAPEFIQIQNISVSPKCQKEKCEALKKRETSIAPSFNPAYTLCEKAGGSYEIITYPNYDEDGLCSFDDGSYILAWDLFKLDSSKAQE